jgi:uncharacterized RDD family membrane protein YckC
LSPRPKNNLQRPVLAPGLLRHLAAIIYDLFLLLAVLFVATALILPLNGGAAFSAQQFIYPVYLLIISFLFYGWFWTHGGQTLGLRAWNLKVLTFNQKTLTWKQALLRFVSAIPSWLLFGLGFMWILIDKDHRSWHDNLSGTALFFDDSKK